MAPHLLHTMLRVGNLEQSLNFYCNILGMKEKKRNDYPEGKFTLVFIGYENDPHEIELVCKNFTFFIDTHHQTYNYGVESYEIGTGFGHIAVGVEDIYSVVEQIRQSGGKVTREPGPMKHGTTVIAFVEDPNGYKIELIEKKTI